MQTVPRKVGLAVVTVFVSAVAAIAQQSPYYITDGDTAVMLIVQHGAIQSTITTFRLGEAIAVKDTVMLCDYDENGVREYSLSGVPTGRTFTGADNYDQLLDGTTDGVRYNYTIAWGFANPNPVLRYDLNWQNPTVLFNLPDGANAMAITYDTTTNHLFIVFDHEVTVREFDLSGSQVNSFGTGLTAGRIAGLAYERATDSLWFKFNGGDTIYNYSKTGTQLAAITVPNLGGHNDWGGEFGAAPAAAVPLFSPWALVAMLLLVGVAGWFFLVFRRGVA